uniref:Suppressor of forked domain-containing protein n=1 Tax=Xenopus tropicalis TaxID=8364 RepID=A0A803K498_XENTR
MLCIPSEHVLPQMMYVLLQFHNHQLKPEIPNTHYFYNTQSFLLQFCPQLFQRCLMKVLHIDLWKCYVSYVRETKGKLPSYKEKMAQAYDFALDKIGMEIMSYQVTPCSFLKSLPYG